MTTFNEGLRRDLRGVLEVWYSQKFAAGAYERIIEFRNSFFAHVRLRDQIVRRGYHLDLDYVQAARGVDVVHTTICMGELRPDEEYYRYFYPALRYTKLEE